MFKNLTLIRQLASLIYSVGRYPVTIEQRRPVVSTPVFWRTSKRMGERWLGELALPLSEETYVRIRQIASSYRKPAAS